MLFVNALTGLSKAKYGKNKPIRLTFPSHQCYNDSINQLSNGN